MSVVLFFMPFDGRLMHTFACQSAVIAQGIAARVARRQASSEQAHIYADWFPKFGRLARGVLEDAGQLPNARAKL